MFFTYVTLNDVQLAAAIGSLAAAIHSLTYTYQPAKH